MPSSRFRRICKDASSDPNISQVLAALSPHIHTQLGIIWDEVGMASQVHPKFADAQSAALTYCVSLHFPPIRRSIPPGGIQSPFCKPSLFAVRTFTKDKICDPSSQRGSMAFCCGFAAVAIEGETLRSSDSGAIRGRPGNQVRSFFGDGKARADSTSGPRQRHRPFPRRCVPLARDCAALQRPETLPHPDEDPPRRLRTLREAPAFANFPAITTARRAGTAPLETSRHASRAPAAAGCVFVRAASPEPRRGCPAASGALQCAHCRAG